MKSAFKKFGLAVFLLSNITLAPEAHAGNSNVEMTIQSFGDLSMFYQALLNTGLVNELQEDQHYTIFAPVNASFVEISPSEYPCFYAVQCRPQIAALLRDHIIAGRYRLNELLAYGDGIQTLGSHPARVSEPFVGDYTVDGKRILSRSEIDGNTIYRIDGALADRQALAQFQQQVGAATQPEALITTKTTTTYTTTPVNTLDSYPAGTMVVSPSAVSDDGTTETTTIIQHRPLQP